MCHTQLLVWVTTYNCFGSGHFWRSRDELISDVLQWAPTYGREKAGRPARTYIQQLCEDTGCSPEDLPEVMNDREKWRERIGDIRASGTTWWWWLRVSVKLGVITMKEYSTPPQSPRNGAFHRIYNYIYKWAKHTFDITSLSWNDHGVEKHWLSGKKNVPGTAVSKEGHVLGHENVTLEIISESRWKSKVLDRENMENLKYDLDRRSGSKEKIFLDLIWNYLPGINLFA